MPAGGDLTKAISGGCVPLPPPEDDDFAAIADRWADRRILMLGESSHGTAEFYRARGAITRRMIDRHGVRIVAVEADWPDAAILNRHVRGLSQDDMGQAFQRFPRWMWRNAEVAGLIEWMRDWNRGRALEDQVGFYGLDLYNFHASIRAVLDYLDRTDPKAASLARTRYGCLEPWIDRPAAYGRAALRGYRDCEQAVVQQCRDLLSRALGPGQGIDLLDAAQNARLVASAERYYRVMYQGGSQAWNLRDSHMADTLDHLLQAGGPGAKAVVWAHNSHIGDARATEMGSRRAEHNLGQLARERWDGQVALIGLGTDHGSVTAASDWDAPAEVKTVRPSHPDSFERLCHDTGIDGFLLDLRANALLAEGLSRSLLQRFIGVIYRPETELQSHYMQARPGRQYDGWIWFDRTQALVGTGPGGAHGEVPDTWPFGL
ncbi:erythromycin esterase family protein [Paracoccus sp. (in: a-proteobacteria)]